VGCGRHKRPVLPENDVIEGPPRGFARRRTGAESSVRGPLVGGLWDCYARAARFIDAAALLRVREHEMAPAPLRADAGGSGAGAKVLQ